MQYTEKLGLKLPESTDNYNIDDFNYNSLKLDNMDSGENIIKYLTPSVEKVKTGEHEEIITKNIIPDTITPTWSSNASVTGNVVMNLESYNGVIPTLTMSNTRGSFVAVSSSSSVNPVAISSIISNQSKYSSSDFRNALRSTTYAGGTSNKFSLYTGVNNSLYFDYDMKNRAKVTFQTYTNRTLTLYGSNDNSTWTFISNIAADAQQIESNDYYQYYRLEYNNNNGDLLQIYYLYISKIKVQIDDYQNQFTISNDLSNIENNQRVLVGTPMQGGNILVDKNTSFSESADHLTLNSSTVDVYADHFTSTRYPIGMFQDNNYWQMNELSEAVFDFKRQVKLKVLKLMKGASTSFVIKYSNDNLTWSDITDITDLSTDALLNIDLLNTNARYIKFYINTTSGYVSDVELSAEYIEGMSLDGVISNTLNGVDIDTLLQPSTKYELVYNESDNKFEIKNNNIFDITLTEDVAEIELPNGIMQDHSIYIIDIIGNIYGLSVRLKDLLEHTLLINNANVNNSLANVCIIGTNFSGLSSSFGVQSSANTGNITNIGLKISTTGPAYLIPSGTRIIIKELK